MAKLKINTIADDKPVKINVELPAAVFQDLTSYANLIHHETQKPVEVSKLIPPMLERFMASDKEFRKMRRTAAPQSEAGIRDKQPDPSTKGQSAGLATDGKPG
jgi:hypothetical protein